MGSEHEPGLGELDAPLDGLHTKEETNQTRRLLQGSNINSPTAYHGHYPRSPTISLDRQTKRLAFHPGNNRGA